MKHKEVKSSFNFCLQLAGPSFLYQQITPLARRSLRLGEQIYEDFKKRVQDTGLEGHKYINKSRRTAPGRILSLIGSTKQLLHYLFSITLATSPPQRVQMPLSTSMPDSIFPLTLPIPVISPHCLHQTLSRTHLKNVFWPNIFVGASLQILNIQQYASGLKLGPAAILNQNPIIEMDSNNLSRMLPGIDSQIFLARGVSEGFIR